MEMIYSVPGVIFGEDTLPLWHMSCPHVPLAGVTLFLLICGNKGGSCSFPDSAYHSELMLSE
jgi:hypothetical protein